MRLLRAAILLLVVFGHRLSALEIYLNRAFTTGEKPVATLYASGEGTLYLRLYRIDDVHAYLSGQANAHTVTEKNERLMQPGYFLWSSVIENMEYAMHQFARRYMRGDYRERLRTDLGLKPYAFPFRDRFPEINLFAPLKLPIVDETAIPVRARHWRAVHHTFSEMKPGYYLLEASQGRHIAHAPLVVSDVAMVTKTSPHNVLIYAVNLKTGEVLSDATVTAYTRVKNEYQRKATFNLKNGLAFSDKTDYLAGAESTLYVLQQGGHYAFSDLYAIEAGKSLFESAIYTDRPVYRIGDTVQVRAVFVRNQAAAAHGKVKYQIKSSDNEILHSGEAELSPAGSLSFAYKSSSLKPGRYSLQMTLENETHYGSFYIEQYKKPETRATFTVERPVVLSGENGQVVLSASYYSGEPLSKSKTEIVIERSRISYPWWYGLGYEEYYGDGYDYASWEFVKDFTADLDVAGKLRVEVATDGKADGDYTYRVRAAVKAQNREETAAVVRFKVYRAPVSLRLSQDRWYYAASSAIGFRVNAARVTDNKPVAAQVKAELIYRQYNSKTQKYDDSVVQTKTIDISAAGEANAEFAAAKVGGTYLIRVSAVAEGRSTFELTETYVYAGSDYAGFGEDSQRPVTVSPGKKKYELYETAEFAVRLPTQKRLPVLVTVENDRVRKYSLVRPDSAEFIHKQELLSELSPNFDLHVTAIGFDRSPQFYAGSAQIVLPPKHRILQVEAVADRDRYRPGEEANIIVRAFDSKKNPVAAEFSLAVVDEAIYSLREDSLTSLPLVLNPRISSSVVTNNSIAFSFYGYGAEKSLYALYREQMAEAAALRKGESPQVKIRKNFKDTAFFTATGKTGADGIARVRVPLPDNLTEWRITTHAHTTAGLSGSERGKLVVAKDFALRLAQPRFLRERDEAKLRLLVSNQLKEPQVARFEANLTSLKLTQPFAKELSIPAGEERYVDFTVTAPFYPADGKAKLQFIARAEKDNDGLELALPVLPYGVENFVAEQKVFADSQGEWTTKLKLDADARSELAEMQISFTAGVIPSIVETLPYLIQYPYGCVEQTLSTFLPAIWAGQAAQKLGLALPVKTAQIKDITEAGLKKLYGYQHNDGGWGWWADDPTDAYMTAYTLWGLSEAEKSNVAVDKAVIKKGLKYLGEQLATVTLGDLKDSYARHRVVFTQAVLLKLQGASPADAKIRAEWNELLNSNSAEPTQLALIAETAALRKFKDVQQNALKQLTAQAKTSAQGTWFENTKQKAYYWYSDRDEITAQVLNAVVSETSGEWPQMTRGMITHLMTQKKQRRWRSTKVSALVTRAFAAYAIKTGEKPNAVEVTASVDGERRDVVYNAKKQAGLEPMVFKTRSREAKVDISRSGKGFFIARAEWKHYLNKPLIVPREGSFRLSRRYFPVARSGNNYTRGEARYAFKAGDLVMTEVALTAAKGSEYLLVEDMIPAGFEPLNNAELSLLGNLRYDNYADAPAAVERLDDRVGLAKTYLSNERFAPRAFYRAVFPGKYQAMPAQGGLMYYPETYAWSGSDVITISE
ncbi:alpha-2-macroglobulin family protein [Turneriella parva]|uniref:Alpha-2-macroglobulin domain protein n=1 Tax=Turneriella parva (strain ATCC BAA-1111 / DSM 21527 / NCTC 11395 / H) TaxID=869212 RepID=I4B956_TURPD|nr:alpha-2-macroglobulin family protein [Turneriella parva]AFM13813.1 alpha-2-macroglobulin domain protein [Turneriella parva DSM 21527]